jgi:pyruvate decarboxylase
VFWCGACFGAGGRLTLIEVGCANELNCSMAAEGYARANGAAACVVTYSVGALSAFNGTGSAYAENLPLILISGSPNTNDAGQFHLLHHTLGTSDFTYQLEMAKKITCCAVAVDRASDAPRLIDRAIRTALLSKKPAYIEIPTNLAGAPCMRPGPISAVIRPGAYQPRGARRNNRRSSLLPARETQARDSRRARNSDAQVPRLKKRC